MAAHEASPRPYFPELDGLRGVAATIVVLAHVHGPFGDLGVSIFFVLSGYLITTLSLREERESGGVDLRAFYIRRAFRIFPIYFLVLGVYLLRFLVLDGGTSEEQGFFHKYLAHYILYLQEYVPVSTLTSIGYTRLFAQTWSLGIEEKFYLVWPLLCFVVLPRHGNSRAAIAAILATLFLAALWLPQPRTLLGYHYILLGCALAISLPKFVLLRKICKSPLGVWVSIVALATVRLMIHRHPLAGLFEGCAITLFLGCIVLGDSGIKRILGQRWLVFLGQISYGIYLVHMLAIELVVGITGPHVFAEDHLNRGWLFVMSMLLSIGIAWMLRLLIELPLIRKGRELASSHQSAGRQHR